MASYTTQQISLLESWIDNPIQFCRDVFPNDRAYPHQDTLLQAIFDHRKVSVASGHGVGKTSCAVKLILWFLTTHPHPRIICTAPTASQIKDVLWAELQVWHSQMPGWLRNKFEIIEGEIRSKEHPATWWAHSRTARKGESESMQGVHSHTGWVLLVLDEASGIDDDIITAMSGTLTARNSYVLAIGNPTRRTGFFYDTHHKSLGFHTLRLDGEEISLKHPELVTPEYISMCESYGRESDYFRVRVKGLFPEQYGRQLFSTTSIQAAANRRVQRAGIFDLVVDVARFGADKTIIGWVNGRSLERFEEHIKVSVPETAGFVGKNIQDTLSRGDLIRTVRIDEPGVGGGVVDLVQRAFPHVNVQGFNGARTYTQLGARKLPIRDENGTPIDQRFANLRAYCYWKLKEALEAESISLPTDPELEEQLLQIPFDFDNAGKIIIPSKTRLRQGVTLEGVLYKLHRSPDKADVAAMMMAPAGLYDGLLVHSTSSPLEEEDPDAGFDSWGNPIRRPNWAGALVN